MLTQRIIDLSEQEILDMELKDLANMFLSDFSKILNEEQKDVYRLDNFVELIIGHIRDFNVRLAISEAFQWLYNKGYIALLINTVNTRSYFITRAGKKRLDGIEEDDESISGSVLVAGREPSF